MAAMISGADIDARHVTTCASKLGIKLTRKSGWPKLGLDITKTQRQSGRRNGEKEPMSFPISGMPNFELKFMRAMAVSVSPADRMSLYSSPSTISTTMDGLSVEKTHTDKLVRDSTRKSFATECPQISKFFATTAILAKSAMAAFLSKTEEKRESSTIRAKARRAKRPEAPSLSHESDDMISTPVKAGAAREGGIKARDFDAKTSSFFNAVCGYTPQTDTRYTGLNAVVAPTSGRRITAGTGTVDENITSADTFTLNLIDQAVEVAKVGSNMVRPIRIGGQPKYVLYLHPYQVTSLRTNSASGQWLDIQKSAMAGGQITNNPIYTGAYLN